VTRTLRSRLDLLADRLDPVCAACLGRCDAEHRAWLSGVGFAVALAGFVAERARCRYMAEGGHGEHNWWGVYGTGLDEDGRAARVRAEWDGLTTALALHGEAGWARWHSEALDWAWPVNVRLDAEALARRVAHERAILDGHRARCVLWRRAHPDWRDGMTAAEHDAFEARLSGDARG
jgi:hypothetical protein